MIKYDSKVLDSSEIGFGGRDLSLELLSRIQNGTYKQLLKSIKEYGVLSPLYCVTSNTPYVVFDGALRLLVCKELGIKVPVCVAEYDYEDVKKKIAELSK